jgi:hypothetical protein
VHYTTSCNTQSSAPEDGQNNCPKHVLLTGIINKRLLLHLVGCVYYICQFVCNSQNYSSYYSIRTLIYIWLVAAVCTNSRCASVTDNVHLLDKYVYNTLLQRVF